MNRLARGLLFSCLCMLSASVRSQDTLKTLPNGTYGLVFTVNPLDTILVNRKKELAPNEFEGTHSTFRIGLGYIGDFTAYSQSHVFKQQMDSLGLSLVHLLIKTKGFQGILASGRFPQRPSSI